MSAAIYCKVCENRIRGNAARETWDEAAQRNVYVCGRCDRLFVKVERLCERPANWRFGRDTSGGAR